MLRVYLKSVRTITFVTHDYYQLEKPKPIFSKGHHAAVRMIKYAWENEYDAELYPPSSDWYNGGYYVKNFGGINNCCAMIKVKKWSEKCHL